MRIDHTFTFAGPLVVRHIEVADPSTAATLSQLLKLGENMSAALDRLTREVSESRTVTESAVTLLDGLAQQIRDLKDDPAALEALANDLDSQQQALAAKISENTPADTGGGTGTGTGTGGDTGTGSGDTGQGTGDGTATPSRRR